MVAEAVISVWFGYSCESKLWWWRLHTTERTLRGTAADPRACIDAISLLTPCPDGSAVIGPLGSSSPGWRPDIIKDALIWTWRPPVPAPLLAPAPQ